MKNVKIYIVALIVISTSVLFFLNERVLPLESENPRVEFSEICNVLEDVSVDTQTIREMEVIPSIENEIGVISQLKDEIDFVEDNIFSINISKEISHTTRYELYYRIKGAGGANGAAKSINEYCTIGGNVGVHSEDWVEVKELICPSFLRKGNNSIRFLAQKGHQFEIKDVRIGSYISSAGQNPIQIGATELIVNLSQEANIFGWLSRDIKSLSIQNGESINIKEVQLVKEKVKVFDQVIELTNNTSNNNWITLEAIKYNGEVLTQVVPVKYIEKKTLYKNETVKQKTWVSDKVIIDNGSVTYNTSDISLNIAKNTLASNTDIIVDVADVRDVAPLPNGMVNVTYGANTYRCLPHGLQFSSEIRMSIPYDKDLIPQGYSYKDIRPYYFDELKRNWIPVKIDSIDTKREIVVAMTDHFSDYINGIIQVPESPSTSEFTPTMMQDIKAANPVANLNLMQAPAAVQTGEGNASFPIQLPAGRQGMQPQLGLSYNSDGGSSWVGYGWNISLPSVSVETRWGVPLFDDQKETEIYTLNGQQLMYPEEYMPNRHKIKDGFYDTSLKDRTDGVTFFYERKLGSFSKIERHGSGPGEYYWKVTTADGTKYWYGHNPYNISDTNLKNEKGISYWPLMLTEDIHGNNVIYEYDLLEGSENFPGNLNQGKNLYISRIVYTGYNGSEGNYEVIFNREENFMDIRKDVVVNGRYGFMQVDNQVLKSIVVKYDGGLIRSYEPGYQEEFEGLDETCETGVGKFFKTLLTSVSENTSSGNFLQKHIFTYYDDIKANDGAYFGDVNIVEIPCDEELPCDGDTTDSDGDGILDCQDNCPDVHNPLQDNICDEDPCGQIDSDGDTIADNCDNCIGINNPDQTNSDSDSLGDDCDNCDTVSNPNQLNSDNDELGNLCDNCPFITNQDQQNSDNDNYGDVCDNCPQQSNNDQSDLDEDSIGDVCDNCPEYYNPTQFNPDADSFGFHCDNCPYITNQDQSDIDGDGIGDVCDPCPEDATNACVITEECECTPGPITEIGCSRLLYEGDPCQGYEYSWVYSINIEGPYLPVAGINGVPPFDAIQNGYYKVLIEKMGCEDQYSPIYFVNCHDDEPCDDENGDGICDEDEENIIINPDFNVTFVDTPVNGNTSTNDQVPNGTIYCEFANLVSSPVGSNYSLDFSACDGTYIFEADTKGVYTFDVSVCVTGYTVCHSSDLVITVVDLMDGVPDIVVNVDIAETLVNEDVTIISLANDQCIDVGGGCSVDPNTISIIDNPNNGDVITNTDNGNTMYSPDLDFVGKDTLVYQVCLLSHPSICGTAKQIITVTEVDCFDADEDGVCDLDDNCVLVFNPNQIDSDNDGIGDVCDGCSDSSDLVSSHTFYLPDYSSEVGTNEYIRLSGFSVFSCELGYDIGIWSVFSPSGDSYPNEELIVINNTNCSDIDLILSDPGTEDTAVDWQTMLDHGLEIYNQNYGPTDMVWTFDSQMNAIVMENIEGEIYGINLPYDFRMTDGTNCFNSAPNEINGFIEYVPNACCEAPLFVDQDIPNELESEISLSFSKENGTEKKESDFSRDENVAANRNTEICNTLITTDVVNTLIPGVDRAYSMLGTSKTVGSSYGGSLGFGIGCDFFAKAQPITGQVGLNRSRNESRSLITMMDINGDGLSDIIEKEWDGSIEYRAHKIRREYNEDGELELIHEYDEPLPFVNINEISHTKSRNGNTSLSASIGYSFVGANIGTAWSKGESTTDIYITDANGDGLPDVSNGESIYFNHLEDGKPTFTTSSEPTENMLVTGEVKKDELLTPIIPDSSIIEVANYDVVKVWQAPADGRIQIQNLVPKIPADAKISIESDINGIYGRLNESLTTKGTCRIYHGDLAGLPEIIDKIKISGNPLDCRANPSYDDPCLKDTDGDGVNDCLDRCPGIPDSDGCDTCALYLNVDVDLVAMPKEEQADIEVTATNVIRDSADGDYHAGNGVTMNTPFEVEEGSVYKAYIEACKDFHGSNDVTESDIPQVSPREDFRIRKGQKLYFRIHSNEDIDKASPEVAWDPKVIYTSVLGNTINAEQIYDQNGLTPFASSYSDGFTLSAYQPTIIPGKSNSSVQIKWPAFTVPPLSDDVELVVEKVVREFDGMDDYEPKFKEEKTIIESLSQTITRGAETVIELADQTIATEFDQGDPEDEGKGAKETYFNFRLESESNVNWQAINWAPYIIYDFEETTIANESIDIEEPYETSKRIYPIIQKDIYKTYNNKFVEAILPGLTDASIAFENIRVYPKEGVKNYFVHFSKDKLDVDCDGCGEGFMTFVVKQNGVKIGSRKFSIDDDFFSGNVDGDDSPIPFTVNNEEDRNITISLYGDLTDRSRTVLQRLNLPLLKDQPLAFISDSDDDNPKAPEARVIRYKDVNFYQKSFDPDGHFYRSWGQFFYNEALDTFPNYAGDEFGGLINTAKKPERPSVANEDDLKDILDAVNDLDLEDYTGEENYDADGEAPASEILSTLDSRVFGDNIIFYFGIPYLQQVQIPSGGIDVWHKWRGLTHNNYSSKFAGRTLNMDQSLIQVFEEDEPIITLEADSFTGKISIPKVTLSSSRNDNVGISISGGGLSGSVSGNRTRESFSTSITESIDLNGDRYPDLLNVNYSRITNPTGGLYENQYINPLNNWGAQSRNRVRNTGLSASGEYGYKGNMSDNPGTLFSGYKVFLNFGKAAAASVSGNMGFGSNRTDFMWRDINGDGLNDRLVSTAGNVDALLNVGDGANSVYVMDYGYARLSTNTDRSGGAGLGFSIGQGESFQAGVSWGAGSNNLAGALMDINGDGLVDRISNNVIGGFFPGLTDDLQVQFNKGNGFEQDETSLISIPQFDMTNNSRTDHFTDNLGATFNIPIFIFFTCLKIPSIGLHGSIKSKSYNQTKKSIEDYDGDGYPDFIQDIGNNQISVRYSNIKRTNKLKRIISPIGAEYLLDYELVPPSYDNQGGKWVLSKVKAKDNTNYAIEGPGEITKYYKYHNPRYDRRERQFYGFEILRSIDADDLDDAIQEDIANFESHIYRQSIAYHHNRNYYRAGKPKENYIVNGAVEIVDELDGRQTLTIDPTQIYTKTSNSYILRDANTSGEVWTMSDGALPANYDEGGTEGLGRAFCIMTQTTSEVFELQAVPLALTQSFEYDKFGRVIEVNNDDEYVSNITYQPHTSLYVDKNLLSIPETISVSDESGLKRKRSILNYDQATGDVLEVGVFFTEDESNNVEMQYDQYGNIIKTISPKDVFGKALITEYEYDLDNNQFLLEVSNNFDFTSTTSYDYRWGVPLVATDITGSQMLYEYDDIGRMTKVKGPKDPDYTIKCTYQPYGGSRPYASTEHYDVFNPGDDITTITIANGFGQSVQVKKDISLYVDENTSMAQMTVSGIAVKDQYGRAIQQMHPTYQAPNNFEFVDTGSPYSSSVIYDQLDRPVESYDFDNNYTVMEYLLASSPVGGLNMLTRTTIDQNAVTGAQVIKEEYKDQYDRVTANIDIATPHGDILTKFEYDGINQILSYTNAENHSTTFEYDLAGRMTIRNHPDAGIDSMFYDNLSNLLRKKTANLAVIDGFIEFKNDALGRPIEVNYPSYENGIQNINTSRYQYYDAGEGFNTGRLKHQEDATGMQSFEYGNMGEIVSESRTIIAPGTPTRTFTTEYSYDSWARLIDMTYPDDEVLNYDYDLGGNLDSISGTLSNGIHQDYINRIGYDHFEQKVYCQYGNGNETSYVYEPTLRRLEHMKVMHDTEVLFDNTYTYDKVGNIESLTNTGGVTNNGLGGGYTHTYTYDNLNRLVTGNGSWLGQENEGSNFESDYSLGMTYDAVHRIINKDQSHNQDGEGFATNTYDNVYAYEDANHAHALSSITNANGTTTFSYDPNGNMLSHVTPTQTKEMVWDELNLMKGIVVDDVSLQHYIYDVAGQRIFKGKGSIVQVDVDGVSQANDLILDNYTSYPSGHITVSPSGRYTKHYYAGTERITSRLSGSAIQFSGSNISESLITNTLPTRQVDGDLELLLNDYGISNIQFATDTGFTEDCDGYEIGSEAWKQCICEYDPSNCPDDVLYFFHSDHLGSATYLTDEDGDAYQFALYLPFGEQMAEQKVAAFSTPYLFNGKELDEETGLYNYGARYYDPSLSVWLGVDPLADEMPQWSPYNYTFNNPINYIDPDGAKPTPREAALIAMHVYNFGGELEGGWIQSSRTFGLNLGNADTGFRSMIYERTVDNKTEFVYAYAGTEFTSLKDWGNNGKQAIGESKQYEQAIANAIAISKALEGGEYELAFAGHSLGGGLAAASSYATDNDAYTFNAAGVSQATLNKNGVDVQKGSMNDRIMAIIMTTDPLNSIQNSTSSALGILMPDVDGSRMNIKPTTNSSRFNGHSMDNLFFELSKIFSY